MSPSRLHIPVTSVRRRPLSIVLLRVAKKAEPPVTIKKLRDALADRSLAAMLLLFAIVNMMPFPPGSSAIIGIPLIIVSAQMVMGKNFAWLPNTILKRQFKQTHLKALSSKIVPRLFWVEKFVRPRYWPVGHWLGERGLSLFCLALALLVTIPIPLGNWLPAFALALLAIAISERDGVMLFLGIFTGIISFAISIAVVTGAWRLAAHLI